MPLYLPVREDSEVVSLTGLLAPNDHELRGQLIEGIIEESEDETLMDRYLGGEEIDEKVLIADLERAVARATFFPVVPVCSVTGVGCAELLEPRHPRLPVPVGASSALGVHPGGRLERTDHLRPRRSVGGRGGQDGERPLRRTAQPGPGLLRHACGPTTPYTSRGTSPPSSAKGPVTRTTTRTSGSAASPTRSARTRSRPARSWRATWAPSAGSPGPRPATPSRRSTTRGC